MATRRLPAARGTPSAAKAKGGADGPMKPVERVPTGIPGLDTMINGGFPRNNVIMVRGEAGTGKTIMCLQYLYEGATEYDEPGAFISFAESRRALRSHAGTFGWDLKKLENENRISLIRYEPHEVVTVMEEGGGTIRDTIEAMGARRLAIDSLTAYALLFTTSYKAVESILGLFDMLNRWDITALVTLEHPFSIHSGDMSTENLGFLADGILDLYHTRKDGGERMRYLEVVKMRDTMHSEKVKKMHIGDQGMRIEK